MCNKKSETGTFSVLQCGQRVCLEIFSFYNFKSKKKNNTRHNFPNKSLKKTTGFPESSTALLLLSKVPQSTFFPLNTVFLQPNHLKADSPSISEHFYFWSIPFQI